MSTALMYCNNQFKKALKTAENQELIFKSFAALEQEIKRLDEKTQLNLYSSATQFLESMINDPQDSINPLEVFRRRCESLVGDEHEVAKKVGLALGVVVIALSLMATGVAAGLGIGLLVGFWESAFAFLASLYALQTASLSVAASSLTLGLGGGIISACSFFKEPKIKSALENCVEAVKQSHLSVVPQDVIGDVVEEGIKLNRNFEIGQ
ncbi:MAG: hypothetical protein Q8M40_03415 [Legionella sp.]|nr:hypothetical protein [Legionella sp.]